METLYFNKEEILNIKNDIITSIDYTFNQDGIITSKEIYSRSMGYLINLEKKRETYIRTCSKGEVDFINYLDGFIKLQNNDDLNFYTLYNRQFIFPISYNKLWKKCLDRYGIGDSTDTRGYYYKDRTYIPVDLYFPRIDSVIEVDYRMTHPDPKFDLAKTLCLRSHYGIKTFRVREYNNYHVLDKINASKVIINLIKRVYTYNNRHENFKQIINSCKNILYNTFIRKNFKELNLINYIRSGKINLEDIDYITKSKILNIIRKARGI
jgi:hypothetical protein